MARVITVTSGAAGVGKTSICINLAAQLARCGQRVCLLDADGGEACIGLSPGHAPRHTLKDLLLYGVALEDVLIRSSQGVDIVPGSPDADGTVALTPAQLHQLAVSLSQLDHYDFVLIDSSTSTARNALSFAQASPEVVLVINPAPISLPNAYSLLKLLSSGAPSRRINVVVNKSVYQKIGRYTYSSFREVASFYLGMELSLLGVVGEDQDMAAAGQALVAGSQAPVARDIGILADQLLVENTALPEQGLRSFSDRYRKTLEVSDTEQVTAASVLKIPVSRKQKLKQQIEYLSSQVDELIQEVERLRQVPEATLDTVRSPVTETSLAALASEAEAVTLQGNTFSIYSRHNPTGGQQYFAWHSVDDCRETSGPVHTTVKEPGS
jgi:flagellar biosynthesis protein FlhG